MPTPCNDGQHCMPFGDQPGIPRYYACACTPGDPDIGMPDSCRDTNDIPGGNGLVVCDATTYDCRPPRDFEQIFDYATTADEACAPNFAYVHVPDVLPDGGQTGFVLPDGGFVPDLPDGGLLFICMERCSVDGGQGCSANWTHCVAGAFLESYWDGGQSPVDGCLANGCGPDVDAGDYYAPCDADGQPGTCQPQPSATGYSGLCLKTGSAALGDACSGLRGLATDAGLLCGANALCIGTGLAPGGALPPATCAQVCDSAQLTPGLPDCQGATTCTKFDGDPVAPDLQAGYCR